MKCFKCGATLSKGNKCPQCGVDVALYKRAVAMSNAYYNEGLDKAKVRDLSGAVESLKLSIALNKNNVEARNLLGLVQCEMGNVIDALSEWVMSKNIQTENNPAGTYIKQIQSNQNKFEQTTTAIKKYNLSLRYVKEGSYDMATIQLKKIVVQNPKLIKAQLLLALMYMKNGEWNKARRPLSAVVRIDHNNTMARLYMKEIDEALQVRRKDSAFLSKKVQKDTESKALSGNDVIIPRSSYREPTNGAITVINILLGIVIGAGLIWFLITPAKYKGLTADYNDSIREYSEQLSENNVEIKQLSAQLEEIQLQKTALEEQLAGLSGENGSNKLLSDVIAAANMYLAKEYTKAAEATKAIDVNSLPSEEAKKLHATLLSVTKTGAATELYNQGRSKYDSGKHAEAADLFKRAYELDSNRVDIIYYAAKSYDSINNTEEAKKYFKLIVDKFKNSAYYGEADEYVKSHQ